MEMTIPAYPHYQHLLLTAEKKFWRCVQNGDTPYLFDIDVIRLQCPPKPGDRRPKFEHDDVIAVGARGTETAITQSNDSKELS